MEGIIDAANSIINNKNKEHLIFRDITPQWFEWLNKISKEVTAGDSFLYRFDIATHFCSCCSYCFSRSTDRLIGLLREFLNWF
jgi:hypothetical protein